jgi:hypothetical protein
VLKSENSTQENFSKRFSNQSLALQIGICLLIVDVTLSVFIFLFQIWAPLVHSLPFLYFPPQIFCFLNKNV